MHICTKRQLISLPNQYNYMLERLQISVKAKKFAIQTNWLLKSFKIFFFCGMCTLKETRMWADAQPDGRPAEYRWRRLRKFPNSIPCTTPQSLAEACCWSAMQ